MWMDNTVGMKKEKGEGRKEKGERRTSSSLILYNYTRVLCSCPF